MIGSDYELFLERDGKHIPVPDNLDIGDKFGTHVKLTHGTMHRDNVMVELCTDPVGDAATMVTYVKALHQEAVSHLTKMLGGTINLLYKPSVKFPGDALAGANAREVGCDRDYLARAGNKIPRTPITADVMGDDRCAGGHVHISYGVNDYFTPPVATHLADMVLGSLEVLMGTQGARRRHYGLAGLFRPKTYGDVRGVEYRTPSNIWLSSRENITAMVTNALAMERVIREERPDEVMQFLQAEWPALIGNNVINEEKADEASAFLARVEETFPQHEWCIGV